MTSKKILVFVPQFPVLSETFIYREIAELSKSPKLDVHVGAFKLLDYKYSDSFIHNPILLKISIFDALVGALVMLSTKFSGIKRSYNVFRYSHSPRNPNAKLYIWLKSIIYAFKLSKYNFEHIHVNFGSESSTLLMYSAITLNIPFSVSVHARDIFGSEEDSDLSPDLIKEKILFSKFITACNSKAYYQCTKMVTKAEGEKIKLLYHGIDKKLFTTPAQELDRTKFQVVYAGRFTEKKGVEYLLDAMVTLQNTNPDIILQMIGYGGDFEKYKKFVDQNALSKNVNFVNDGKGSSNAALIKYIKAADVFVMPSIETKNGDSDGIPNTILEVGFCKKPLITTNAGSITEVVEDGKSGLLVHQKNVEDIVSAILKIKSDKDLAEKLALGLNSAVETGFDISTNIKKLEKLLLD